MDTSLSETYTRRARRIEHALTFQPVDRVPFILSGWAWAPTAQGMSMAEFSANPESAITASLDTLDDLDAVAEVDGINNIFPGCFPYSLAEASWSRVAIPGFELGENELWQVREAEVMSEEDYDYIIDYGWQAYLDVILPKVRNTALQAIHEPWVQENMITLPDRYRHRGFVPVSYGATTIPFEPLSSGRSMARFFRDCYRRPEKVKQVLDIGIEFYKSYPVALAGLTGVPAMWVGGWRAASEMVAPKIWNELVWPYYVQLIEALHAAGIRCVLHFDSNWDRDVPRFLELPKGSCVLSPDGTTDLRRAREILGDHMPVFGDVPAALLSAGTPADVRAYVRDLIRDLGRTGLVMTNGCDMPFNTPKANAEAMLLATHEFGGA